MPLNMCILGINLSSAAQTKNTASVSTICAVVVGKMIIMPIVGILTTLALKKYLLDIPASKKSAKGCDDTHCHRLLTIAVSPF